MLLRPELNPFDPKTVLPAKHMQHVLLIHFPIALFLTAVGFDVTTRWTKRPGLVDAAYYSLFVAAISTLPAVTSGVLAWQFQLDARKLRHPADASRACSCFQRNDLAGLGTLPRPPEFSLVANVSSSNRVSGPRGCGPDWAPGWILSGVHVFG